MEVLAVNLGGKFMEGNLGGKFMEGNFGGIFMEGSFGGKLCGCQLARLYRSHISTFEKINAFHFTTTTYLLMCTLK